MEEYKPLVLKDGNITRLPDGDYISGDISDVPQKQEIDFVGDTIIYKGWTQPGTLSSDALWKIQRITFTGVDKDVTYEWADSGNYTQIWDDRASLTYA